MDVGADRAILSLLLIIRLMSFCRPEVYKPVNFPALSLHLNLFRSLALVTIVLTAIDQQPLAGKSSDSGWFSSEFSGGIRLDPLRLMAQAAGPLLAVYPLSEYLPQIR